MTLTEQTKPSAAGGSGVTTVASLARDWAQRAPEQVAMREKDFGIWQEMHLGSRRGSRSKTAAHGADRLGVEPGDRVSIHSEDRPGVGDPRPGDGRRSRHHRRFLSDQPGGRGRVPPQGLRCLRALRRGRGAVRQGRRDRSGRAPESPHDHLRRAPRHGRQDRRSAAVLGQPRRDGPRAPGPAPERGRRPDGRGHCRRRDDAGVHVGNDRPAQGRDAHQQERRRSASTRSSTPPTGCRAAHPTPSDQIVTYLPLCHVAERIFSTWTMVGAGPVLNFAESIETVNENLREVQPTIFFAVPRIWEKLHAASP